MRSSPAPVPDWALSTMCLAGATAVPGMLVITAFGAPPSGGVAAAISGFAAWCVRLAFAARNQKALIPPVRKRTGQK